MLKSNDITIIIPYHKDKNMLKLSLTTLEATLNNKNLEIIIVANNINKLEINISDDLDRNKYSIYEIEDNLFWPGAINFGAKHASGKYLLFCDPDIFYTESWLEELIDCFNARENVGAVSSKLINPLTNRIMDFGMGYNQFNTIHITKGLKFNHPLCNCDREVQAACGGILLTSHDLFEKVNGIDISMPYIYCDNDYSIKLSSLGFKTFVSHKSIVYHKGNTDLQNSKYENFKYLREDSKAAFYAKNYTKRKNDLSYWLQYVWNWYLNNSNNKQSNYYLFNFCTLFDKNEYVKYFIDSMNLNILNQKNIVLSKRDANNINLCNYISSEMIFSRIPFIYFVDDFLSLLNNKLWFHLRDISKDIVIDRHCNIINMYDIALNNV